MSTEHHDPYSVDISDFDDPDFIAETDDDAILRMLDVTKIDAMRKQAQRNISHAMRAKRKPSRKYLAEQLRVINLCTLATERIRTGRGGGDFIGGEDQDDGNVYT